MKKILLLFLVLFKTINIEALLIIPEAIKHISIPEQKVAVNVTSSTIKSKYLQKLTIDYWNYLKTGKGDYYLYFLIGEETLENGYKRYGLTANDVQKIKEYFLSFKKNQNIEEFAFSVLPSWLKEYYEFKGTIILTEFFKKENVGSLWPEIFQGKYEQGLVEYLIQEFFINRYGHKRYIYTIKDFTLNSEELKKEVQEIVTSLNVLESCGHYIHINDLSKDQKIEATDKIIVPFQALENQNLLNDLNKSLDSAQGGNPDATIIVVFDDEVKSIPNDLNLPQMFHKVKNLIVVGKGIESVGREFLYGFMNLVNLNIPEGLISVGDGFLADCRNLVNLNLPKGLISVGDEFLSGCRSLESLKLPESLNSVGSFFLEFCTSLEGLILPESLRLTGSHFLRGCSNLQNLTVPYNLKSLGDNFLADCVNLVDLVLSEGLEFVGDYFLEGCTSLKTLILPNSLKAVGVSFLNGCTGLEKLFIKKELLKKIKKLNNFGYLPNDLKITYV